MTKDKQPTVEQVTEADALRFMDRAFRNSDIDGVFDTDDLEDLRTALDDFRIAATRQASADLEEALGLVSEMLDNLKHCALDSGSCHCGDDMRKHAPPMISGHTPVDMGWTAAEAWIGKAEPLLARHRKEGGV